MISLGLLLISTSALALQADRAEDINRAITRGVRALKESQKPDGSWGDGGLHAYGRTSLCAWALLEAGIKPEEDCLKRATSYLRKQALENDLNYNASLGIIFFDRLGDPADEVYIQGLAAQLLAGFQPKAAGWSYSCGYLEDDEKKKLVKLRDSGFKAPDDKKAKRKLHPTVQSLWDNMPVRISSSNYDNSNTQFAIMAMWVARRHGAPVDSILQRVEARFRKSQSPKGGWAYEYMEAEPFKPHEEKDVTPAMTCAGLVSLALANGTRKDPIKDMLKDKAVQGGFKKLTHFMDTLSKKKDQFFEGDQGRKNFYFLWSLERMAVVYDVKEIGSIAWYPWGVDLLLASQAGDTGAWNGEYGDADTCFALLFLKRANVAADLTQQFQLLNPIQKK